MGVVLFERGRSKRAESRVADRKKKGVKESKGTSNQRGLLRPPQLACYCLCLARRALKKFISFRYSLAITPR